MASQKLQLGLVVLVIALVGFIGIRSLGINIPLITGKVTEEPEFNRTRMVDNCKTACQARVLSGFKKVDEAGNCWCEIKNLIPTQTRVRGQTANITVVVDKEVNIGKINKVNITLTSMLRAGLQRNMTIDQILQRGARQQAPTGQMPTQRSPTQQG